MNFKIKLFRFLIAISSIVVFVIMNLHYYLISLGGLKLSFFGFFELLFLVIGIISIVGLLLSMKNHKDFRTNRINYLFLAIGVLTLLNYRYGTLKVNQDTFKSKTIMKFCYEGTMNTSYFNLRKDSTFEYYNMGFMGNVYYRHGSYHIDSDTILLNILEGDSGLIGNKIYLKDNFLYRVENDNLIPTLHYLGDCKGLN